MNSRHVTILVFASYISCAAVAGLNEAHIPMVPPPYQMAETPRQNSADLQLSEKVEKHLKANLKNYNPESNMIVSQKGEVILQGKVSSPEEEQKILEVIKKVKGVAKVKNRMVVLAPSSSN